MKTDSAANIENVCTSTNDETFEDFLRNAPITGPALHGISRRYPFLTSAIFVGRGPLGTGIDALGGPEALVDFCRIYLSCIGARQPEPDRIYLESSTSPFALKSPDAWLRLLEDMEFGRYRILVVPNLQCLLPYIPDAYRFNRFCKQHEIEIHTVDRGLTSDLDFAMYQYVGREDLVRRPAPKTSLTGFAAAGRTGDETRPTRIIQLEKILGSALSPDGPSLWWLVRSPEPMRLVLQNPSDDFVSVDARHLETGLLRACDEALEGAVDGATPPVAPNPEKVELGCWHTARRMFRTAVDDALDVVDTEGGLGLLSWQAIGQLRRGILGIGLEPEGPARHRMRLYFHPRLELPHRVIPGVVAMDLRPSEISPLVGTGSMVPPLPPMRPRGARPSRQN